MKKAAEGPLKGILEYGDEPTGVHRLQRQPALLDLRRHPDPGDGRQLREGLRLVRQRVGLLEPHGRRREAHGHREARPNGHPPCSATSTTCSSTGKRVFIRVDFNVPLDDKRTSPTTRASARRCRPSATRSSRAARSSSPRTSVAPRAAGPEAVAEPARKRLAELLGKSTRCCSPTTAWATGVGKHGEGPQGRRRCCCSRTCASTSEEEANDEAFARELARCADVYVQRRVRHRAPRPRLDRRHGALREGEVRRLPDAEGDRVPGQGPQGRRRSPSWRSSAAPRCRTRSRSSRTCCPSATRC